VRVAFVIPWFGPDLKGGAEQQAWQFATRLARRGNQVDVLTTCCRSFLEDWATNHLPEGVETLEQVTVRRFPVDARDRAAFDALNGQLLSIPRAGLRPGIPPVDPERARPWTDHNINSGALESWLAGNHERYDAVVFIPYLYGPTLRGVHLVAGKAWMQPCLHDEVYAYLPDVASALYASQGLLFLSAGERDSAVRLFGPFAWTRGHVVGAGIEFEPLDALAHAPLPEPVAGRRFLLFLGRRDAGKGTDHLCNAFRAWRARGGDPAVLLVLAGPGVASYDDRADGIVDLGLVDEATRVALLRNCVGLAMPSPNESFSRVLYEAWYCRKPAIVRTSCDATREALLAAGGGWTAEGEAEWSAAIDELMNAAPATLERFAAGGRDYTIANASWDGILERCEGLLSGASRPRLKRDPARDPVAIDQLSPNFAYGDAISNEMLEIQRALREAGFQSEMRVRHVDPALLPQVRICTQNLPPPHHGLIYHHSIGSEVTSIAIAHPGPKALLYHNITPAEHFRRFRPGFARLLRDGREQMWSLAPAFPVSAGDSAYNAAELARFGFAQPGVLPLPVDPASWCVAPTPAWMERLGDGRPNILFVGRVAPNKRQDRLVEAFALLPDSLGARLVIAGSYAPDDPFARSMLARIDELGLADRVIVTGHCALADLHAFYRTASVFWSFSEHEGFCVPLVEAMWFDVPVAALTSSAVPETLGDAGMQFRWDDEDFIIARRVQALVTDPRLRQAVLGRQRERRQRFVRDAALGALGALVERMREPDRAREAAHV
jgi:glycosyltransferase involved in cell wall biosynthesis